MSRQVVMLPWGLGMGWGWVWGGPHPPNCLSCYVKMTFTVFLLPRGVWWHFLTCLDLDVLCNAIGQVCLVRLLLLRYERSVRYVDVGFVAPHQQLSKIRSDDDQLKMICCDPIWSDHQIELRDLMIRSNDDQSAPDVIRSDHRWRYKMCQMTVQQVGNKELFNLIQFGINGFIIPFTTRHLVSTIGVVAGDSENFWISWAALLCGR